MVANWNAKLLKAAECGDIMEVKRCVENGANVECENSLGFTALLWASERGHTEVVEYLITNHNANIEARIKIYGETPLMRAAFVGNLGVVKCLLQHKADVNAKSNRNETALMLASSVGHKDIVECLIEYNADVTIRNTINISALDCAKTDEIKNMLIKAGAK